MENTVSNQCSEGTGRGGQRGEIRKFPDQADTSMHLFNSVVVAISKLKFTKYDT